MCAHHSWATTSHKLPSIQMTRFFQSKLEPLVTDHILWATVTPGPRAVTTFWADSFIYNCPFFLTSCTRPLDSWFDLYVHCVQCATQTLWRVYNEKAELYTCAINYLPKSICIEISPWKGPPWPDSRKRPLTLRILGSRLREVLLF